MGVLDFVVKSIINVFFFNAMHNAIQHLGSLFVVKFAVGEGGANEPLGVGSALCGGKSTARRGAAQSVE